MATPKLLHACKDGTFLDLKTGNVYAYDKPAATIPVQMRESAPPVKAAVKAPPKPTLTPTPKPKVKSQPRNVAPSQQALGYLREEVAWLQHQPTETTAVFSLNEQGDVCGCTRIQGTADRCDFDAADVIREAVGHKAVSIVVLHNHPHMGGAEPSPTDDHATATLREALAQAGIWLFDHFIVARSGHVHSYREADMEPESLYDQRERESRRLWSAYGGRPSYA